MYYPTLEEVRRLKKYGNLVPVCRDIQADLETPVSAYLKIARGNYPFLLESVESGERPARYSFKERAEGIMLVDLGRNDIGRISEPGTVEVTQLMDVERYSHVMHLVSHVQGKLRTGLSQFDALRSCFPAGTVSGAPKIRAMEIHAELERDQGGPHACAVGYFDFSGNMDTAIAIRTIVIKNNIAYIQAGAGLVADSIPEHEYQENLNRVQASLAAIDQAEADQYAFTRSVSS